MTGFKFSTGKTIIMRWNSPTSGKVQVDGEELEEVSKFVYLGGTVTQKGGSEEDIKSRLGKASTSFNKLRKI